MTSPKKKRMSAPGKRSKCWDFFSREGNNSDNKPIVQCLLCKPETKTFVYDGSTGNMCYHLRTMHADKFFSIEEPDKEEGITQMKIDDLIQFSGAKKKKNFTEMSHFG